MAPEEEEELVRGARAGRREDFEALVRRHHVQVLRLCISLLAVREKGEDAAQEVFLKAYRSLDRFQGDASFSTWLYRIATNHCLDILRKEARRRTESWEELVERDGEALHRLLASPAPSDALEASDLAARVLSHLPEDYRLILTLREAEGLSYQEIAEVLSCSLDSVKARLRRAREALQERLRHFSGPGGV